MNRLLEIDLECPKYSDDVQSAPGDMVGSSPELQAAIQRLDLLALSRVPILLLGETGTGKELAARRAHALSSRSGGPFVAHNAAGVSEALLLADLFGHVRGAFTGADRDRVGLFETATGGTLLLDEIGDLPLTAQGALLRVLQEGEIRRVGESRVRKVDVRVIAATYRDLEHMTAAGEFRQDLFFRLGAGTVTLPSLRERPGDVIEIAEHLLRRGSGKRLSAAAREALVRHEWPGNVRELENVLRVASTLAASSPVIRAQRLPLPDAAPAARRRSSYHELIDAYRRRLVSEALEGTRGHRASAARQLGITRQALSYLMRRLEIA